MNSSFLQFIFPILFIPFFLLFFIVFFFSPFLMSETDFIISSPNCHGFIWPVPSSTTITSYFGYRRAPTSGSSTYHSGVDIAANVGSPLVAVISGKVTDTGFRRCWWLYHYFAKRYLYHFLLSCFSSFYSFCWRFCLPRRTHWLCRS